MWNSVKKSFFICAMAMILAPLAWSADRGNKINTIRFGTASLSTGVTLHYAEQGAGKKNVVILLHGYLDSWFSYSEVMKNMPTDFHVISITQRGHGDSGKPETGYAMTDYSEDVVAFMDHFGYNKASIVGHSMGSVIAQRVAIDHPDRVHKLVLIGPTGDATNNEVLLFVADAIADLEDPIDRQFVYDFQSGTAPDPISDQYIENIVSESQKVPARVWKAALDGLIQANYSNELYLIQAETLLMWGDEDEIFLAGDVMKLAENIPNVRLQVYPNLNHSIQWQRPRLAALEISAFLRAKKMKPRNSK